jgi:hypothetical protein
MIPEVFAEKKFDEGGKRKRAQSTTRKADAFDG